MRKLFILIHNIANWLKIQKMVNPEIYFFFSFCKTIRANLQQYTTNVILFKLECIYYMYENANDVSLKNDIYVQLKFYKYMYTSIGIKLLAVLNIQHVEHLFYRFFFSMQMNSYKFYVSRRPIKMDYVREIKRVSFRSSSSIVLLTRNTCKTARQ